MTAVVEQALEAGFSHIDTGACMLHVPSYQLEFVLISPSSIPFAFPLIGRLDYENEEFVGAAIRESGLPREDLWMTDKYSAHDDDVQGAVRTSLRKLGLAHLDLYLVHDPSSIENDDVEGLWGRMVEIHEAGLAKCVFSLHCFARA